MLKTNFEIHIKHLKILEKWHWSVKFYLFWNLFSRVPAGNCFPCYLRQHFVSLENAKRTVLYFKSLWLMVFVDWKLKIARLKRKYIAILLLFCFVNILVLFLATAWPCYVMVFRRVDLLIRKPPENTRLCLCYVSA